MYIHFGSEIVDTEIHLTLKITHVFKDVYCSTYIFKYHKNRNQSK